MTDRQKPRDGVRVLDCDEGRSLGCDTFCCRLLVRLQPDERDPGQPERTDKHCIDKDPYDGLCVYLDRATRRCGVWEHRPRLCRDYDCNDDPLLEVVLRKGFVSLTRLVRTSRPPPGPTRPRIPRLPR